MESGPASLISRSTTRKLLPFRAGRISAPRQALVGGDVTLARQRELLIEQRVGDEIGAGRPVELLDLPVPAGEGNAEHGLAEIAWAPAASVAPPCVVEATRLVR